MLQAVYLVSFDANDEPLLVTVDGATLLQSELIYCDLQKKITGSQLMLAFAFKEDIEPNKAVPPERCEWVALPELHPALEKALLAGKEIPLHDTSSKESFILKLGKLFNEAHKELLIEAAI